MKNWAGNYEYRAARVHYPTSLDEVRDLVMKSQRVRTLGTRHCFHDVADSPGGDLISLQHLDRMVSLDVQGDPPTVTIEGGMRWGALAAQLNAIGYALRNAASLPHISLAGAVATGTHGSGDRNQGLASAVLAMQIVRADGEVRQVSRERHGDFFDGMVVALGSLGVVTKLTLEITPAFAVAQEIWDHLPFGYETERHLEEIFAAAYSVSLFTDWQTGTFNQVWLKRRVGDDAPRIDLRALGAMPATGQRHPVQGSAAQKRIEQIVGPIDPQRCTIQGGVPGPWHERLPHFRMEFVPSFGAEVQSEYIVPRHHAIGAMRAVRALSDRIGPLIQISEIRTIAADRLWMSPFYERESLSIHFTWRQEQSAVMALLPDIERALAPFDPRPHWGKLFRIDPHRLAAVYPKLNDFRALVAEHDPAGKFRNPFVDRNTL